MSDAIDRQAAIDALNEKCLMPAWCKVLVKKMLTDLPSVQPDKTYEQGWKDGREALRKEMWEDGRDRLD